MSISSKYAVLKTKIENINKLQKKAGYEIYSCYSNLFAKNVLITVAFKKLLLKWTEFWLSDSSTSEKGLQQMVLEQK